MSDQEEQQQPAKPGPSTSRRGFLTLGAGVLGGLALGASAHSANALAPSGRRSPSGTEVKAIRGFFEAIPDKLSAPRHLPRGFRFFNAFEPKHGGFLGAEEQLSLLYRSTTPGSHGRHVQVFLARGESISHFHNTRRAPFEIDVLATPRGPVTYHYFGALWGVGRGPSERRHPSGIYYHLSTTGTHVATLNHEDVYIAVEATAQGGGGRDGLVTTLRSMF